MHALVLFDVSEVRQAILPGWVLGCFNWNLTPISRKRGPTPKWQLQIEAVAKLPKARQKFVSEMLDTVLAQH